MRQSSPEAQFPALFGKHLPPQAPTPLKPADLRLLQWCMRQASQSRHMTPTRPASARQG